MTTNAIPVHWRTASTAPYGFKHIKFVDESSASTSVSEEYSAGEAETDQETDEDTDQETDEMDAASLYDEVFRCEGWRSNAGGVNKHDDTPPTPTDSESSSDSDSDSCSCSGSDCDSDTSICKECSCECGKFNFKDASAAVLPNDRRSVSSSMAEDCTISVDKTGSVAPALERKEEAVISHVEDDEGSSDSSSSSLTEGDSDSDSESDSEIEEVHHVVDVDDEDEASLDDDSTDTSSTCSSASTSTITVPATALKAINSHIYDNMSSYIVSSIRSDTRDLGIELFETRVEMQSALEGLSSRIGRVESAIYQLNRVAAGSKRKRSENDCVEDGPGNLKAVVEHDEKLSSGTAGSYDVGNKEFEQVVGSKEVEVESMTEPPLKKSRYEDKRPSVVSSVLWTAGSMLAGAVIGVTAVGVFC